jgi:hypothetical protein
MTSKTGQDPKPVRLPKPDLRQDVIEAARRVVRTYEHEGPDERMQQPLAQLALKLALLDQHEQAKPKAKRKPKKLTPYRGAQRSW